MTPHTPGPWTADNFGMKVFTSGDPYGHGAMNVADVRGWGHLTGGGACKFNEVKAAGIQLANARLIAAAPALLEELVAARAYVASAIAMAVDLNKELVGARERLNAIDAVIAKASKS